MTEADNQSRLPVKATPQFVNQSFIWINNRRNIIKTRKSSGVSSLLLLPAFVLEFLFWILVIGLLLLFASLYVMFRLLISLPKIRKGTRS